MNCVSCDEPTDVACPDCKRPMCRSCLVKSVHDNIFCDALSRMERKLRYISLSYAMTGTQIKREMTRTMKYPDVPGFSRKGTSEQAANEMRSDASTLRDRAYEILRQESLTADEVATRIDRSVLSIRPRLSELVKKNKIVNTGDRRKNLSGKDAIVWKAV